MFTYAFKVLFRFIFLFAVMMFFYLTVVDLKLQVENLEQENHTLKWLVRECRP